MMLPPGSAGSKGVALELFHRRLEHRSGVGIDGVSLTGWLRATYAAVDCG